MVPRVLVLEPYPDLRAEIAATLQRAHFDCDAVGTAEDAAAELGHNTYEYVVVDVDTVDSRALLASISPVSQVIRLTCRDDQRSALRKPFSRAELMARFTS